MVKPERQSNTDKKDSSPSSSSSSFKYTGVRKRKWGKFVSEIRLPNSRERIWLGSYDTAEKAARAFDAALFCLRGRAAKFNFPNNPPDIMNGRSMTQAEIQVAAALFANTDPEPHTSSTGLGESSESCSSISSSSEFLVHAESPCPSISDEVVQFDGQKIEKGMDNEFVDLFSSMGTTNYVFDFGIFPGFDDLYDELFVPSLLPNINYVEENYDGFCSEQGSFLWNF